MAAPTMNRNGFICCFPPPSATGHHRWRPVASVVSVALVERTCFQLLGCVLEFFVDGRHCLTQEPGSKLDGGLCVELCQRASMRHKHSRGIDDEFSSSLHPDHELSLAKLKAVHGAKKSAGSLAINSFNSNLYDHLIKIALRRLSKKKVLFL